MVLFGLLVVFFGICVVLAVSMVRGGDLGARWYLGGRSFWSRDNFTRGDQP
jgi:hypothetical protein